MSAKKMKNKKVKKTVKKKKSQKAKKSVLKKNRANQPIKIKVMTDFINADQPVESYAENTPLQYNNQNFSDLKDEEDDSTLVATSGETDALSEDDEIDNNKDEIEAVVVDVQADETGPTADDLSAAGQEEVLEYLQQNKARAGERVLVFMAISVCVLVVAFFWWKTTWGKIAGKDFLQGTGINQAAQQLNDVKNQVDKTINAAQQKYNEAQAKANPADIAIDQFNKILINEVDYTTKANDYVK